MNGSDYSVHSIIDHYSIEADASLKYPIHHDYYYLLIDMLLLIGS